MGKSLQKKWWARAAMLLLPVALIFTVVAAVVYTPTASAVDVPIGGGTIHGTVTYVAADGSKQPFGPSTMHLNKDGTDNPTPIDSNGAYVLSSLSGGKYAATASFTITKAAHGEIVGSVYSVSNDNVLVLQGTNVAQDFTATKTSTGTGTIGGSGTATCASDPTLSASDSNCKTDTTVGDDTLNDCGFGPFNWLACGGVSILTSISDKIDNLIMEQLNVDTNQIFAGNNKDAYYAAWNSFRIIATAIIILAGLAMVTSQAFGFEFLDAYTIRKTLPRLLIAVIGISLSWPLLQLAISFFNVVGFDIRNLMYAPFGAIKDGAGHTFTIAALGNPITLVAAGTALFLVYGAAAFTFLLTAFLAIMIAFLVLVIRQIAIVVLVIMAPIAIACYILPNTQKVWKFWLDNFMGLMLMFPIISALIAAGHIISAVGRFGGPFEQFVSFIAYFAPYFLLPIAFRLATGIIGNLSGMINDRSKGAFDRLKNARGNAAKDRHSRRMNEQLSNGRGGDLYRRLGSIGTPESGALSMTSAGRAKYANLRQKSRDQFTAEALKNDNGRAAGDDDATALAVQTGMTRSRFLREYQQATGRSEADAENALAMTERGFGAKIGTNAMAVTAFKARASSSTSYSGDEAGTRQRMNEGGALIAAGLMTEADTTAAGKGNRARVDINGGGFNTQMTAFREAAASIRAGGDGITLARAQTHLDNVLQESDPGDILAGNTRTIEALAPAMMRNLNRELTVATTIAPDGTRNVEQNHIGLNRALGQIAGVQDNLNRSSPQKAAMFADTVNGIGMINGGENGEAVTVRQMVDTASVRPPNAQGGQSFLEVRKEYGSAGRAHAAGADAPVVPDEEH